tara:strand:- start:10435 stop:10692 length:258 start_codon:yes stop_codon:yes gene_type:complete
MDNHKIWVFLLDRIRGPFELWEIKLMATKYRDFFIYTGNGVWVPYRRWNGLISCEEKPVSQPEFKSKKRLEVLRFLKRSVLRNCH